MADAGLRLKVIPPTEAPYAVDIGPEMLIGRSDACDLTLAHETVSSNHALITVRGTAVAIKDLDSTNGTVVAGNQVRGEHWLRNGMVIEIGAFRLELVLDDTNPATATERLPGHVIRLDERDRGVVDAVLAEWADPKIQAPAARGAEEMARTLHVSRQEVNRRVGRLEEKLNLPKGSRGAQRYHRLAEELLRRGFTAQPS